MSAPDPVVAFAVECAEDAYEGWIDDEPGTVPPRPCPENHVDAFAERFCPERENVEADPRWDAFYATFEAHFAQLTEGSRFAGRHGGVNVASERQTSALFDRTSGTIARHLRELRARAQSIREQAAILEVEANGVERIAAGIELAVTEGRFYALEGVLSEGDREALTETHPTDPAELLRRDTWAPEATRTVQR